MNAFQIAHVSTILSAMAAMAAIGSAGFFARFWRTTRDAFYAYFALAFTLLAADQLAIAFVGFKHEALGVLFWVRIAGYALILLAIVLKNLPPARRS